VRVVVALGGNALLQRNEQPDAVIQRHHVRQAAAALAPLTAGHQLVLCHGNGPQVGMLALESQADTSLSQPYPLDVLVAQTQGMIGYWLVQELSDAGVAQPAACVISQTVVDASDPAFGHPTKFIGAVQVHDVLQAGRERDDGLLGVIAGPVEPPVHGELPCPQAPRYARIVPGTLPLRSADPRI
jgi:carbamate kinase